MKKMLKSNLLVIIIALIIFIIIGTICYKQLNDYKKYDENRANIYAECKENIKSSNDPNYIKACEEYEKNKDIKIDFFSMLTDLLVFGLRFINYIAFTILTIPTMFNLSKFLKNKFIINTTTRESYKAFFKEYLKQAYKYLWLLPLIGALIIIICLANTTLDPTYATLYNSSIWSSSVMQHPIAFIIYYLINLLIYSFVFINIDLLIIRKHHNIISSVILAIIVYLGIELFMEIVINNILFNLVFKSSFGYIFNIVTLYNINDTQFDFFTLFVFIFILAIISFATVCLSYRNKEKFIIDCEKNN